MIVGVKDTKQVEELLSNFLIFSNTHLAKLFPPKRLLIPIVALSQSEHLHGDSLLLSNDTSQPSHSLYCKVNERKQLLYIQLYALVSSLFLFRSLPVCYSQLPVSGGATTPSVFDLETRKALSLCHER